MRPSWLCHFPDYIYLILREVYEKRLINSVFTNLGDEFVYSLFEGIVLLN